MTSQQKQVHRQNTPLPIQAFLSHLQGVRHYSLHTTKSYAQDLKLFASFIQEHKHALERFTRVLCRQYLFFLKQRQYSLKTIARHLACLRCFWDYLIEQDLATKNPWKWIKTPKQAQQLPQILSQQDMAYFLDAIPKSTELEYRNYCICELIYSSGLRVSELVSIQINQLYIHDMELRVLGKGNKERIVIFGQKARNALQYYIDYCRYLWTKNPDGPLFVNKQGQALTSRSVQRVIKALAESLGFTGITPHILRHCFATDLYNNGADLRAIQDLLGHENITTTQIYTHLCLDKLKKTIDKAHHRSL